MISFHAAPDFATGPDWQPVDGARDYRVSYFDTAELGLLRAGVTLRRTGAGWRLDAGEHRQRWPMSHDLPDELAELLAPWAGEPPLPVLTLRCTRTRYQVLDAGGEIVRQLADDQVRAHSDSLALTTSRWRQLRLERGPAGSAEDLRQAADLLARGGAIHRGATESGLDVAVHGHRPRSAAITAGELLAGYLRTQCEALAGGYFAIIGSSFEDAALPAAVAEPPEAVHQTRVATRRLRAMLRTYGALFDADAVVRLEAELAWYAGLLGPVRDAEVMRSRLARAVAELPADLVVGPVAERIDQALRAELGQAGGRLHLCLREDRYRALAANLAGWRSDPPFGALADQPASALGGYVEAAEHNLSKRLARAGRDGQDASLHSARKAGKRARYAAEAAGPALGGQVSELAGAAKRLQEVLGEHQDSVVAVLLLCRLAEQATRDGQNAFSYGVLVAGQLRLAAKSAKAARAR
ncbi:MAG: CHAD domain-containing protein [Jatrophihabitans sp.]